MLKQLYLILYSRPYAAALFPLLRITLSWLCATPVTLTPVIQGRERIDPALFFLLTRRTDRRPGFGDGGLFYIRIGAKTHVLNSPGQPLLGVAALYARSSSLTDVEHFRDAPIIYGLGLFTSAGDIFSLRYRLRNCAVAAYLDNNDALSALFKGVPPSTPVRASSPFCCI